MQKAEKISELWNGIRVSHVFRSHISCHFKKNLD